MSNDQQQLKLKAKRVATAGSTDVEREGETISTFNGTSDDVKRISVTQSSTLIQGSKGLSAKELELLYACIATIDPTRDNYEPLITVKLDIRQISELTETQPKHIRQFIDRAAKSFHSLPIRVLEQDGSFTYINIALRSMWNATSETFYFTVHPDMRNEIIQLRRKFASTSLHILNQLRKTYSKQLYLMIDDWYNPKSSMKVQTKHVPIFDLLHSLGLVDENNVAKGKYNSNQPGAMLKDCLNPAIKEVNEKSEYTVTAHRKRVGARIGAILFEIKKDKIVKSEIIIPEDTSVSSDEDVFNLLESLSIPPNVAERFISKFETKTILANIRYIKKLEDDGFPISSRSAFLNHCLKHNFADLPAVANPHSAEYKNKSDLKEFVANVLLPIWWKLPSNVQSSIKKDKLINNLVTSRIVNEFIGFQNTYCNLADTLEFFELSDVINEWTKNANQNGDSIIEHSE